MIDTSRRAAALWALIADRHVRDRDAGIFASADRCAAQRDPLAPAARITWRIAPASRPAAWHRCNACRRTCRASRRAAKVRSAPSKPTAEPKAEAKPRPNRSQAETAPTEPAAKPAAEAPAARPRAPKAAAATPAKKPSSAQVAAIRSACRADYQRNCASVPTRRRRGAELPGAEQGEALGELPAGRQCGRRRRSARRRRRRRGDYRRCPAARRRRPWCCGRCVRAKTCSCCARHAAPMSARFAAAYRSAAAASRVAWRPGRFAVAGVQGGRCRAFAATIYRPDAAIAAYRRDRRRTRRPLLRLSVEKAAPGRPYRPVRAECRRRHLGIWRGVLRTGARIPARRRSRDGRRHRAANGELEEHHPQPARRERRDRRRRLLLDRPARSADDPAAARRRGRRHAALRHHDPVRGRVDRLRPDRRAPTA